jgi:hypothetical protein
MAEVTVFVDDAVLGRLPDICALDGVPASGRLRVTIDGVHPAFAAACRAHLQRTAGA